MSIFSLVKGEKEHEVFEMRMWRRGVLNSYMNNKNKKGSCHIAIITAFKNSKLDFTYRMISHKRQHRHRRRNHRQIRHNQNHHQNHLNNEVSYDGCDDG